MRAYVHGRVFSLLLRSAFHDETRETGTETLRDSLLKIRLNDALQSQTKKNTVS